MRILDEQNQEVQSPDLEKGYLKPDKYLIQHHEEVQEVQAVYEDVLQEEYDNGGRLYNHVCTQQYVPYQAAWDEYEDIQRYVKYTEEELQQIEEEKKKQEEAQKEAEEAAKKAQEEAAASQRMNLAVQTMSLMMMPTMNFTSVHDATVATLEPLYSEWNSNSVKYKKGDPFYYIIEGEKRYFRASQDTTSTSVYKPGDVGTESIYYEIFIASDGILIWQDVKGDYNSYGLGERVHYPNENGKIYESLVKNNSYSPDVRPDDWKVVE